MGEICDGKNEIYLLPLCKCYLESIHIKNVIMLKMLLIITNIQKTHYIKHVKYHNFWHLATLSSYFFFFFDLSFSLPFLSFSFFLIVHSIKFYSLSLCFSIFLFLNELWFDSGNRCGWVIVVWCNRWRRWGWFCGLWACVLFRSLSGLGWFCDSWVSIVDWGGWVTMIRWVWLGFDGCG